MAKYTWTTHKDDLKAWDVFLKATARGHYSQLSDWLRSYESYGFGFELLLVKDDNNQIIGGLAAVIQKFAIVSLYSCSCGPILLESHDFLADELVERFKQRAKEIKATCCQINIPVLAQANLDIQPYCLPSEPSQSLVNSKKGNVIKSVTAINGFRVVSIDHTSEDPKNDILRQFNTNTRRNIKKAYKNELTLAYAQTEQEIKEAYQIIEANASTQGYAVRAWSDFKETLIAMVNANVCLIAMCLKDQKIKGALILFEAGQRLTYISGGTIRETPDLKVGHFLHFEMIKLSIAKKYNFYDISVGGSRGVTKFKEGFGGVHVKFHEPSYWVLNKTVFSMYSKLLPSLKKHKKKIANVLKFFK